MSTVVYPSHKAVDLLFKKGDRLQTKNWRPISLLVYNIYPRLAPSSVHRTTPNRLGEPRIEKVEKRLSSWRGRSLSYQGRALVINALALSQIWHLCAVFVLPGWVAARLDKAIWPFFWEGKRDLVA